MMPVARDLNIVILDNYDSFVYNLYQRIGEMSGVAATVVRNDQITLPELRALAPTHLIISPGPGSPDDPNYFGVCRRAILEMGPEVPTLGVCLGHQGIGSAFGAQVVRSPLPMHGKTSLVDHREVGIFTGVPNPVVVMRYHSLMLHPATIPSELQVTATTSSGIIMGIQHRRHPIYGVQFHPESIGTPHGIRMLANFLGLRNMKPVSRLIEDVEVGIDATRTPAPLPRR